MVIGRFKYEHTFSVTRSGFVVTGQIVSGTVRPGSYLRFLEDGVYKDARIAGVEHGNRNDHAFVGLPLDDIAKNYFDNDNEKLTGAIFDIIE